MRTKTGVGDHGKSAGALGGRLRRLGHRHEAEAAIDDYFDDLAKATCTRRAAQLLGRVRAAHYRRHQRPALGPPTFERRRA